MKKMRGFLNATFLILAFLPAATCQNLEKITPVIAAGIYGDTGTVFILNTINLNYEKTFRVEGEGYYNSVQIIDAAAPWPPRWYTYSPCSYRDTVKQTLFTYRLTDARYQNGQVTFYKGFATQRFAEHKKGPERGGFIICNQQMQAVDTLTNVDQHDFRINGEGERLVLRRFDTVLDMSKVSGNPKDKAVNAQAQVIEVLNSRGKTIFKWNPMEALGIGALYPPYWLSYGGPASVDYSHCNSAAWDFDGNIIYSFRHIGIGKISRKDGHVIWRFERKDMPFVSGNDSVWFFLQHSLQNLAYNDSFTTYTLYSDGDSMHRYAYGLMFRVDNRSHKISEVKKKLPEGTGFSQGGGDYEVDESGNYLLNYGAYFDDRIKGDYHVFLEYGRDDGTAPLKYKLPYMISSYKVHKVKGFKPPRPQIVSMDNSLTVTGKNMNDFSWYKLSSSDNTTAQLVGKGIIFSPKQDGMYCVVGKYGIGYACSLAFDFKK